LFNHTTHTLIQYSSLINKYIHHSHLSNHIYPTEPNQHLDLTNNKTYLQTLKFSN